MANLQSFMAQLTEPESRKGIAGLWLDEHAFVEAARKAHQSGLKKIEAISPFPLHGIDEALGLSRSYIPWLTFLFGLLGCAFGLWFTWWTSAVNWPIIVGGKPMWSLPAFIPIIFECTILFAALASVAALFLICGLPKVDPPVIDPGLTSHKFALFIPENESNFDFVRMEALLKQLGAQEIKRTEF